MSDCLFCRIAAGEIPATKLFQDDDVVAFADVNPQAPTHLLVIPRKHVASLDDARPADRVLLGRLLEVGAQLARERGLQSSGYRAVVNTGPDAGQSVFHLHLHVLAGRRFSWPPG